MINTHKALPRGLVLILFISLSLPNSLLSQCYSGSYTVGGNAAYFQTFAKAIDSLKTYGVCGPVSLEFLSGTYSGANYKILGPISGVSATNTLTITSQAGSASSVILDHSLNDFTENYTFYLSGAKHIIFEHLTINSHPSSSTYAMGGVMRIRNTCDYITIRNCSLTAAGSGFNASAFTIDSEQSGHISVHDNTITSGKGCVRLTGGNPMLGGHIIRDNIFLGNMGETIQLAQVQNTLIERNRFDGIYSARSLVVYSSWYTQVLNNQFHGGMFFGNAKKDLNNNLNKVINNIILVQPSDPGLEINGSEGMHVFFNTFVNNDFFSNNGDPLWKMSTNGPGITLYNNLLYHSGNRKVAEITIGTGSAIVSGYNAFDYPGSLAYTYNGQNYTSLSQLQSASSLETGTVTGNAVFTQTPGFIDNTNIQNSFFDGKGIYLSSVSKDIQGQNRTLGSPDIGADEFTIVVPSPDIQVSAASFPAQLCPGTIELEVQVKNLSPSFTVTSGLLHYSINGVLYPTVPFQKTIPAGTTSGFISLKAHYLGADSVYQFKCWTSLPNGYVDNAFMNDTLTTQIQTYPSPAYPLIDAYPICEGDSVLVQAVAGFSAYQWAHGPTTPNLTLTEPGIYSLTVTDNNGCQQRQATHVFVDDIEDHLWMVNGQTGSGVVHDGTLYLAGSFSEAGPYQPGLAAHDYTLDSILAFPYLNPDGQIHDIVSDEKGGWFLAGEFETVGHAPRHNLAHVDSLGHVLPLQVEVNGLIRRLAYRAGHLYLGGDFDSVQNVVRRGLADIDPATGLLRDLDLDMNPGAEVWQIGLNDSFLVVTGRFFITDDNSIVQHKHFVTADLLTHTAREWWGLNINDPVEQMAMTGDSVFFHRHGILKGVHIGTKNTFYSKDFTWVVIHLGIGDGALFIIEPSKIDRVELNTLNLSTVMNLHPNTYAVHDMVFTDTSFILAGRFWLWQDTARHILSEFNLQTYQKTGIEGEAFRSSETSEIQAFAMRNGQMVLGGRLNTFGSVPVERLAAIDLQSGRPTDWQPKPNGPVRTLEWSEDVLYVGGDFTEISGQVRQAFAAYDVNGQLLPMSYAVGGGIYDFAFTDTSIYMAGDFLNFNGQPIRYVAAVKKDTTELLPFNPRLWGGDPGPIEVAGNRVYIDAGEATFVNYNGSGAPGHIIFGDPLVAVTADSGQLLQTYGLYQPPYLSTSFAGVYDMKALNDQLYVSGSFGTIGGFSRKHFAQIDGPSGNVMPLQIDFNLPPRQLVPDCGQLYTVGAFDSVNNLPAYDFALLDLINGSATPVSATPVYDEFFRWIAPWQGEIFTGGYSGDLEDAPRQGYTPLPMNCLADFSTAFSLDLGPDTVVCDTAYLLQPSASYSDYLWSDGSQNTSLSATQTGWYSLEVVDQFGCTASDSVYVELISSPLANFAYQDSGLQVSFTDLSVGSNTYFWDFGDGNVSTLPAPIHQFAQPDSYYVELVITGSCGADTLGQWVVVSWLTSLDPAWALQMALYPNPATGAFRMRFSQALPEAGRLMLMTPSGQIMREETFAALPAGHEVSWQVQDLPRGLYLVGVKTNRHQIWRKLILR
ncbi:MAG: PKD domain-containing protein [Bacteroidota bacterium]